MSSLPDHVNYTYTGSKYGSNSSSRLIRSWDQTLHIGSRRHIKQQKQRTRRSPVSLCQNQRATEKEWSCVKGQGDSCVSAEQVGGGGDAISALYAAGDDQYVC